MAVERGSGARRYLDFEYNDWSAFEIPTEAYPITDDPERVDVLGRYKSDCAGHVCCSCFPMSS